MAHRFVGVLAYSAAVGDSLDREAARQAFSLFQQGSIASPNQIEFIEPIVQVLEKIRGQVVV